jgi:hypothetical protein
MVADRQPLVGVDASSGLFQYNESIAPLNQKSRAALILLSCEVRRS